LPPPPDPSQPRRSSTTIGPRAYCDVEFKRGRCGTFLLDASDSPQLAVAEGDLVKVDADRGVDLGRVVRLLSEEEFRRELVDAGQPESRLRCKKLLRRALKSELDQLPRKAKAEAEAMEFCRAKVKERALPMTVVDAEYQFDHRKLTFYFEADRRIDFRELVRDLFAVYRTRIWLQQLA